MGWHSGLSSQAGLSGPPPATWDEYLTNAKTVVDSGAAPFGATFDAHGWRSLAPITHSLSTDVYTSEGLFDFTSDPAIEALMMMKKMMALSHPDILLAGRQRRRRQRHAGRGRLRRPAGRLLHQILQCPAPHGRRTGRTRAAEAGALPKFAHGEGSTVFWTTGACLFKHGQNKEKAAEYIKALTYDAQIWKDSIAGTETGASGPAAAVQVDLRRLDGQSARLDARVRRLWCAASSTWPRRSPTTSSACSSS